MSLNDRYSYYSKMNLKCYYNAMLDYKQYIEYDINLDSEAFIDEAPYHDETINYHIRRLCQHKILSDKAMYNLFMKMNYHKHMVLSLLGQPRSEIMLSMIEKSWSEAISIRKFIAVHNMRLVIYILKDNARYRGRTLDDWISEGSVWILGAIDSYNPLMGFKFTTYLAKALAVNSFIRTKKSVTLTADGLSTADIIEDTTEYFMHTEQRDELSKLRKCIKNVLSARELKIIEYRYGLYDSEPLKLKQVGVILGISMERVRQIEKIALIKLKKYMDNVIKADLQC